jgi:hypothetical protein
MAESEISKAVSEIIKKHDLTYGELMFVLANETRSWAKCMIKDEREDADEE